MASLYSIAIPGQKMPRLPAANLFPSTALVLCKPGFQREIAKIIFITIFFCGKMQRMHI